jgi:hypothetical protein
MSPDHPFPPTHFSVSRRFLTGMQVKKKTGLDGALMAGFLCLGFAS